MHGADRGYRVAIGDVGELIHPVEQTGPPSLATALGRSARDAPAAERIFEEAVRLAASDVHLGVGSPPIVRVGGALGVLDGFPVLEPPDLSAIARWVGGSTVDEPGDH